MGDVNLAGISNIEFDAVCTGDGDAFCWEVDKETYIKIKGWEEFSAFDCISYKVDENDKVIPLSNTYRIYPNDIFGYYNKNNKKKIKIEWEDLT